VTSVAYPAQPQLPGWVHSSLALVVGWVLGAAATFVLYGAATFVGAMSRPYGWHAGVLNEWPFPDNGLWSLIANFAVIFIALLLTTVATSWWLRRKHERVSDGRLAVVLFFTGWIPLATKGTLGLFGFLVAVVLVRFWVGRHDDYLRPVEAAVLVAVLSAVVLSFGLTHPLWTASVRKTASTKNNQVEVVVHNAARIGVTIDRLDPAPLIGRPRPSHLHLAPGADGSFRFSFRGQSGCGTALLGLHARYQLLGLTLTEKLPAQVSVGRPC
jgi:hypothetical protein